MVAQGKRGQELGTAVPPRAALGQRSNPWFSSPPESPLFSDSGGEVGRGGDFATEWRVWRFVVLQIFLGTKREFRESARYCPLTPTLSPNTENVLGERVETGWNADPGRRTSGRRSRSSCLALALGCNSPPPLGAL